MNKKAKNEIKHGTYLAENNTELLWGWDTPAGKKRAQRRANLISNGASLSKGSHALEIGCGTGMFTEIFANSGAKITAADISNELLKKAKKRNLPHNQVTFINKRFEDFSTKNPFDAIIGSSILHHLEIAKSFDIIFNLLKPGGVISFAEPNLLNPQVFLERKFRKLFSYVSPDEIAFVKWKLKKDLQSAGFINIEIFSFDWLHPSIPKFLIPITLFTGYMIEKIPILKEFSGSLYIKAQKP